MPILQYMETIQKPKTHIQLGYVVVWDKFHPLADKRGRVMAHRKIMFDLLGNGPHPCFWCGVELPWRTGRKVKGQPGLEVDHLDADRSNNALSNLVPVCPSCQTKKGRQGDHTAAALERVAA